MDPLFAFHKLNDGGQQRAKRIADAFDILLDDLDHLCTVQGREWSLVKTKLEEACFFAKKSMAMDPQNQE